MMQVNSSITFIIGKGVLELIHTLTQLNQAEIICQLADLSDVAVTKVRDPNFKQGWSIQRVVFPNTPLVLRAKAKFKIWNHNVKTGGIEVTFDLHQGKKVIFSEEEVATLQVEEILLKDPLNG